MQNLYKLLFITVMGLLIFCPVFAQEPKSTVSPASSPTPIKDTDPAILEEFLTQRKKDFAVQFPMSTVYAGDTITVGIETTRFLAQSNGNLMHPIKWKVITGGEIIEGDGTPQIKVKTDIASSKLSVSLEIVGFYGIESATDTGEIALLEKPKAALFSELKYESSKNDRDVEAYFQKFFTELMENQTAKGRIIIHYKKNNVGANIEKLIKNYAREKNLSMSKIEIVRIRDNDTRIRYFIVPPGASAPMN